MTVEPIIESFRKLPAADQINLLQQLWNEIAEEIGRQPLTEGQRRLLDERLDEHEAEPENVEPWEQPRDEILREL